MMSDGGGNSGINKNRVIDEVQNSYGVQVTNHPLMLIMIKGIVIINFFFLFFFFSFFIIISIIYNDWLCF